MTEPSRTRRAPLERWLELAVLMLGCARLALLATADLNLRTLTFAAPDDTFYYLQIAWNWGHGLGSTFDGIHPTNGYQPLWGLLLTGCACFLPSRAALLDVSIGIACAFHVAAGVVLARAVAHLFAPAIPSLVLALWLLSPELPNFLHLESPLNSLALAGLLLCAWRSRTAAAAGRGAVAWLPTGLVAAAAALTRLDNVVMLPALGLWAWLETRPKGWAARLAVAAAVLAPAGVALAVYAALNWIYIGAPLPVSGTLKAGMQLGQVRDLLLTAGPAALPAFLASVVKRAIVGGPALLVSSWFDPEPWKGSAVAVAVPCVLALVAVWGALRPGLARDATARRLWAALLAGVGCHFLFMLYMVGTFPREWHWIPEAMVLLVAMAVAIPGAIGALAWHFGARGAWAWRGALAALGVALALRAWPGMRSAIEGFAWGHLVTNDQIRMSRYWAGMLPPGTRVGAWNAGYLGYFTDLQVVNLDGLVNAPDFAKRTAGDRWLEYCQETGIRYIADTWGGAFDLLARELPIVDRRRWGDSVEYVLLRVPDAAT